MQPTVHLSLVIATANCLQPIAYSIPIHWLLVSYVATVGVLYSFINMMASSHTIEAPVLVSAYPNVIQVNIKK